jgi:hypothetical protein
VYKILGEKTVLLVNGVYMPSEVVSLRVPLGTANKLKLLAARRSLQERREVRWSRLVRDAIRVLLAHAENQNEGVQPAVDEIR